MKLFGVTRDNSYAEGKPKIFLCCHPLFPDTLRNRIAKILLDLVDAVVYMDDEHGSHAENGLEHIRRMNLIIFVVDAQLFSAMPINKSLRKCCDLVLNEAHKNNIPVMPVAVNGTLLEQFNKAYGTLQCLNIEHMMAEAHSIKSEPEKEVLKKWLNEILISGEITEKIREEFEAYIFLSYRKKDREYVEHMMRLLHSRPEYRDVAVWFDDYLLPGEDFNNAILNAMDKSTLFSLLVTPNLLEQNNYVMTTEYTHAKKENKTVFPVEFVPTDRVQLKKYYNNLPESVSADNPDLLKKALERIAEEKNLKSDNNSPEHLFYMGLAYLTAIDMETDHTRAKNLIFTSAKAGYLAGIKQLALMYKNGLGVEQSIEDAIYWQKLYLQCLYNTFGALFTPEHPEIPIKEEYSEEDFNFIKTASELVSGIDFLMNLYIDSKLNTEKICSDVLPLFRLIYQKLLFITPLVSQYDAISGYEKVKEKDGKWTLRSIKTKIFKLTGCVYNADLAKILLCCEKALSGNHEACARASERYKETNAFIKENEKLLNNNLAADLKKISERLEYEIGLLEID